MGRKWTQSQKDARSIKGKLYWKEHPHPRKGQVHSDETKTKMRKPKQRPPVSGHCQLCGRPVYSEASKQRGVGPTCAGLHDYKKI